MNCDKCREPRPQPIEIRLSREKHNLDRHSLNDLGEIASSIVRRQQGELRTAGRGDLLDLAVKHSIWKRIDPDIRRVAGSHIGELSLFEVRLHPDFALNQVDHWRSRSDQLTSESAPFPNRSISRCRDLRIGQIHLGDNNGSLLRLYISLVNFIFCGQRLPLALRSLKLALAAGQDSLGAREIRFPSV